MISTILAIAVLRGPFPLLNTPWTEEAKLDIPVLVREAEYVNGCGTGGIIWPTAPELKDLDAAGEYETGLTALAERAVSSDAPFTARVTATCAGTNEVVSLALARKVEAIARKTGAKMAILARPPDNATNQTMIAAYYRALAKVTTQPVIIQTYNGKSPQPDVALLVELAKEHPEVYGYVKEESPGDKVNDRMAELLTHPEIKGVFSGWGGKGWIYQGSRIGTCGVISQRPAYASLFVKIWNRLAAGADASDPELADAYMKYLYMVNLGDIFSKWGDDEMRGPHLYVLQRLGIFRNTLTREGPGKVKEWPMTDKMRSEIDARLTVVLGLSTGRGEQASEEWPSAKTAALKDELVQYARANGHADFAAKIAAEANTTDWIGETLAYATKLLKACEGRDFRDSKRRTALELIDYPLHVDNYNPRQTTVAETNAWEKAVADHLSAARERVLAECAAAKVPDGSLRLWRIYNMAYLVKGPRHTVLIDLSNRPYISGLWTESDFARFADLADVFVLTHPHRDHYCSVVLQAFLTRKKSVVLPCDLKLNDPNAHILDKDHAEAVEIAGVKFRNFLGNQGGVPCNVYWMEIDGVRLTDNGDNSIFEKDARLADCPPVDAIIAATWNRVTNMVASCMAAQGFDGKRAVFLPSHENELGHSVAHREGYRRMYANPDRLGAKNFAWPRVLPLHWGESVTIGRTSR